MRNLWKYLVIIIPTVLLSFFWFERCGGPCPERCECVPQVPTITTTADSIYIKADPSGGNILIQLTVVEVANNQTVLDAKIHPGETRAILIPADGEKGLRISMDYLYKFISDNNTIVKRCPFEVIIKPQCRTITIMDVVIQEPVRNDSCRVCSDTIANPMIALNKITSPLTAHNFWTSGVSYYLEINGARLFVTGGSGGGIKHIYVYPCGRSIYTLRPDQQDDKMVDFMISGIQDFTLQFVDNGSGDVTFNITAINGSKAVKYCPSQLEQTHNNNPQQR